MKKIISLILVFTMLMTTVNISFAEETGKNDATFNGVSAMDDISNCRELIYDINELANMTIAEEPDVSNFITNKSPLACDTNNYADITLGIKEMHSDASPIASTNFVLDANLLTSFNTVTAPKIYNGANEPKFSYNKFLEENISDYSGELTLNFEDIVLD